MMAQLLEDSSFCEEFIQQCPAAVEVLNLVAQECSPGEHVRSYQHPKLLCTIPCVSNNSFFNLLQESVSAWLRLNVKE